MKKLLLTFLSAFAIFSASADQATPLWLRYTAISPDGGSIAFTYKGDIYIAPTEGGNAFQLTTSPSHDTRPVWSNDSKTIAFMSDREGGFDIYTTSSRGGEAKRITFNSSRETPFAFTNDNKNILYSAPIQRSAENSAYPNSSELYMISTEGGRYKQVFDSYASEVSISSDGKKIVYEEKPDDNAFRKHHVSSASRDIWIYDTDTKEHSLLFDWKGEDTDPVFSKDGKSVYFLSERVGSNMNVFVAPLSNPKEVTQVTSFKKHPVRYVSVANNGTLAFSQNGEIYTKESGSEPKKVKINIVSDKSEAIARLKTSSSGYGATVSADGKQVAFIYRGNVFVTSSDYSTTKQITDTADAEATVEFSPDGRSVIYASERGKAWNIYSSTIVRDEEANFANATLLKEVMLFTEDGNERYLPKYSPDGEKIAYLKNRRELWISDADGQNEEQVTDGRTHTDFGNWMFFSWSPDSKWFVIEHNPYIRDPYCDVALVNIETKEITNITESAYFYHSPRWVMDGNAILHTSNRYGMRNPSSWGSQDDVMITFLNKKSFDDYKMSKEDEELANDSKDDKKDDEKEKSSKKKSKKKNNDIVIEKDGLTERTIRLTGSSSFIDAAILDNEGSKLYYVAKYQEGRALWCVDLKEGSTTKIQKTDWGSLDMDEDGNIYLFGNKFMRIGKDGSDRSNIDYVIDMKLDKAKEREYMFKHIDIQESKMFYNKNMHGVNWDELTEEYKRFLPHINNNYDYSEMLSEMLGELNVSHTGSGYRPTTSPIATATLGLFYDMNYNEDGLKVTEIITGSPFDNSKTRLETGDIITAINGKNIYKDTNIDELLTGITDKKTLITYKKGKKSIDEVIYPISASRQNNLLYKRWIESREKLVDSLSGGRLGYVHIDGMDDSEFRKSYSKVLGKFNKREGIVIDIRFNRGGRLHEDIEAFFSAEQYLMQIARDVEYCTMPSRRWTKPSVMVMNEACYSNAHGTPWVYKYKKMGKLIGMPVAGTMTTVSWETLQDKTLYFGIPVIGYKTADGMYLENYELQPDVLIQNTPQSLRQGRDLQIEEAVKSILETIDNKNK